MKRNDEVHDIFAKESSFDINITGKFQIADTFDFGTIIQLDDLLIFENEKISLKIAGPIVGWRSFPRSKLYTNQLHVILEECIDIYIFIPDLFTENYSNF